MWLIPWKLVIKRKRNIHYQYHRRVKKKERNDNTNFNSNFKTFFCCWRISKVFVWILLLMIAVLKRLDRDFNGFFFGDYFWNTWLEIIWNQSWYQTLEFLENFQNNFWSYRYFWWSRFSIFERLFCRNLNSKRKIT